MKRIAILAGAIALAATSMSAATTRYVIAGGSGSGSSWQTASGDLQAMVNASQPGDIVLVAAGRYQGNFCMHEGVCVIGGYNPATGERIAPAAAAASELSVLDAGGKGRTLTQVGNFLTPTYWDGFAITGGAAAAVSAYEVGMLVYMPESDSYEGKLLKYNADNTGTLISATTPRLPWGGYQQDVTAVDLDKTKAGGVAEGSDHTAAIVEAIGTESIDFSAEGYATTPLYAASWAAHHGAGWHMPAAREWRSMRTAKQIDLNVGFYWIPAALGDKSAWAERCETASPYARPKYEPLATVAIANVTLPEVPTGYANGGGVFLNENGIVRNCLIYNCNADGAGGAAYLGNGAHLVNCIISDCMAGAGSAIAGGEADAVNCTITRCGGASVVTGNGHIANSIIWGNTAALVADGAVQIEYSCYPGANGAGCINADPQLNENHLIGENSPAREAGRNEAYDAALYGTTDALGNSRFDGTIDMGAAEYSEASGTESIAVDCGGYSIRGNHVTFHGAVSGIEVYNVIGQRVMQVTGNEVELPTPGVYILSSAALTVKVAI